MRNEGNVERKVLRTEKKANEEERGVRRDQRVRCSCPNVAGTTAWRMLDVTLISILHHKIERRKGEGLNASTHHSV